MIRPNDGVLFMRFGWQYVSLATSENFFWTENVQQVPNLIDG
ncbi:hypothetical protein HDF08_003734 [Edaphobacter lichenicola]|uniref:Uncharacterized protein n=1 Tax=Tunturiibacter lichenicola TaxID=2051959 RepID=A0A852VNH5_9BACT|nr:hypothetical protein [Edaphobacter lichenicola]